MKPAATSKEEILSVCRELIRQQQGAALNVRQVASACGISVGTVYNYFGSKADLVGAAVESVWYDIFRCADGQDAFSSTVECLHWLFERLAYGGAQYPGFFTLHSVSFAHTDRPEGKQRMERAWQHIRSMLCSVLRRDSHIRAGAFGPDFTVEECADLLFSLLLAAQLRAEYDPTAVLQLVRRLLY